MLLTKVYTAPPIEDIIGSLVILFQIFYFAYIFGKVPRDERIKCLVTVTVEVGLFVAVIMWLAYR